MVEGVSYTVTRYTTRVRRDRGRGVTEGCRTHTKDLQSPRLGEGAEISGRGKGVVHEAGKLKAHRECVYFFYLDFRRRLDHHHHQHLTRIDSRSIFCRFCIHKRTRAQTTTAVVAGKDAFQGELMGLEIACYSSSAERVGLQR